MSLDRAVIHIESANEGTGAARAESHLAGNLSRSFPIYIGCRVMLTRNVWSNIGLMNGAQGVVHVIVWAEGSNVLSDPPQVIMVTWDNYTSPSFRLPSGEELKDSRGKLVVPVERVRHEFTLHNNTCCREQFPLIVSYTITVHKSQGVTLDRVVCDISISEFASGLSYVAVSRVSTLKGLLFDAPFDRSRVFNEVPLRSMQLKIADYERRKLQALLAPLYEPSYGSNSDEDAMDID